MTYDLSGLRESAFIGWIDKEKTLRTNDDYFDERYYSNPVFPKAEDSDGTIRAFIADALKAEKKIIKELVSQDEMDEEDAIIEACQWPLKKNAPMDAVRAYLKYVWENAEAAEDGLIID